jgi:3-hydroxyisobutyrate dehydrogenase
MTDPREVAVIGLGNMGNPMAGRLIAAGHAVHGYDVGVEALARFQAQGGFGHPDAVAAAATADVVILLLPDSTVVHDVVSRLRAAGLPRPGSTVIDMGSSEPMQTRLVAEALAGDGVRFIDAPVSGGVSGAEAGTLTVMAGGPDELVARFTPLLSRLGAVIHVGPLGAGHAVKALNNLISATHLWMTSEAVTIGEQFGIAPETTLRVLNGSSGRSGSSEAKWPKFILTGRYDSGFAARLMLKDAKIAARLADELGMPTDLGEQVVQLWAKAVEGLPAQADHTEIARWIQERANTVAPKAGGLA